MPWERLNPLRDFSWSKPRKIRVGNGDKCLFGQGWNYITCLTWHAKCIFCLPVQRKFSKPQRDSCSNWISLMLCKLNVEPLTRIMQPEGTYCRHCQATSSDGRQNYYNNVCKNKNLHMELLMGIIRGLCSCSSIKHTKGFPKHLQRPEQ